MEIKATVPYEREREETVAHYAARHMDGSGYDTGHLEAIARSVDKITCSYGRLIEALAEKGLLTAPEVTQVVEGYTNIKATFIN